MYLSNPLAIVKASILGGNILKNMVSQSMSPLPSLSKALVSPGYTQWTILSTKVDMILFCTCGPFL